MLQALSCLTIVRHHTSGGWAPFILHGHYRRHCEPVAHFEFKESEEIRLVVLFFSCCFVCPDSLLYSPILSKPVLLPGPCSLMKSKGCQSMPPTQRGISNAAALQHEHTHTHRWKFHSTSTKIFWGIFFLIGRLYEKQQTCSSEHLF